MVVLDAPLNDSQAMFAATAGLNFLEQPYRPHGRGLDSIDLDTLNMDSTTEDVLGQLYGTYDDGLNVLGLTGPEAAALGFDLGDTTGYGYEALTDAWLVVLCERSTRQADAA